MNSTINKAKMSKGGNHMDQRKFRDLCGSFATGVTVVTTQNENSEPIGMTANSFTSLSLDPPLILFNISKSASLFDDFMTNKCFAVNILSANQESISRHFSKKDIDRFDGVDYSSEVTGAPILRGTLGYFDCEVVDRFDGGDHIILIGKVKDGSAVSGEPLVFYKGKYTKVSSSHV